MSVTAALGAESSSVGQDAARAGLYAVLARLLYAAPDAVLLDTIAHADSMAPQSALSQPWHALQAASAVMDAEAAAEEYAQLFVGLGQGETVPYMSWHLTGFMMEEPLARLREAMAENGLVRADGVGEPEDHIAAVCEVMRLLVAGDVQQQRMFFDRFLRPWYVQFAVQLETAPSANYYRAVARLLREYLDIEAAAFDIGG